MTYASNNHAASPMTGRQAANHIFEKASDGIAEVNASELRSILSRLHRLGDRIDGLSTYASKISEDLFGSAPSGGSGAKASELPQGTVGEVHGAISRISETVEALEGSISRIGKL